MNYSIFVLIGIIFISVFTVDSHRIARKTGNQTITDGSVHSSPEHTSEGTSQAAAKSTSDKQKECPAACRPMWLKLVTQYLGSVKTNTHPMCQFKTYFSDCDTVTNSSCTNPAGKFICCPLRCLNEINACWQGSGTNDICLPESVPQSWAMQMANAFFTMNG